MITIEPVCGLGNRMRVISSAAALAQDLDMPLEVVWRRDRDAGCCFADLFEPVPPISHIRELDLSSDLRRAADRFQRRFGVGRRIDFDWRALRRLRDAGYDLDMLRRLPGMYLSTFETFYPSERDFMTFVPVPSLQRRIDAAVAGFGKTIGVHVRRGDNERSIEGSPLELFVDRMGVEIDAEPATNFFLATDSPDVDQALHEAFPGRILTHRKRSLDRRRREAIEDAVVDLFCLARTTRLFASFWSSFSETASMINGIPYEVIRTGPAHRFWW
jgi:hypothetical protein